MVECAEEHMASKALLQCTSWVCKKVIPMDEPPKAALWTGTVRTDVDAALPGPLRCRRRLADGTKPG